MEKKIEIVYQDEQMMLVYKPAGFVTTLERVGEKNPTVEAWLEGKVEEGLDRSGIVHRLDKGTSGLLLVAGNKKSLIKLKDQFRQRLVVKKYYALVAGEVGRKGVMEVPIGRKTFGKFGVKIGGKRARTEFVLLQKYRKDEKMYSLVEVTTKTGRTHQIRVHFSYLGWPLVGDTNYGGERLLIDRPFLHAYWLEINHPTTGRKQKTELPLPADLVKVLAMYEKI